MLTILLTRMCFTLFDFQPDGGTHVCTRLNRHYLMQQGYRLIIGFNRDEEFDRPTAPAEFWPHAPVLAGTEN